MNKIQTAKFIDVDDLSEEFGSAYRDLVQKCAVPNGSFWAWKVGCKWDESLAGSYIGRDNYEFIDNELRFIGLEDGVFINLMLAW